MKTPEEWANSMFHPDEKVGVWDRQGVAALISAAQREAAEWMREEAAKVALSCAEIPDDGAVQAASAIRAIKLPGKAAADWEDLRGAAPDATGDLSSEEFVRKCRDEWR